MAKKMYISIPRLKQARSWTGMQVSESPVLPGFKDDALPPGWMFVKAGPLGAGRQVDGGMAVHEKGVIFFPKPSPTPLGRVSQVGNSAATGVAAFVFGFLVPGEVAQLLDAESPILKPLSLGSRDPEESLRESINHPSHFAFSWSDLTEVLQEPGGIAKKRRTLVGLDNGEGQTGTVVFDNMGPFYASVLSFWRISSDVDVAAEMSVFRRQQQILREYAEAHNLNVEQYKEMTLDEVDKLFGCGAKEQSLAWWSALTFDERKVWLRSTLEDMLPTYAKALALVGAEYHDMGWLVEGVPVP